MVGTALLGRKVQRGLSLTASALLPLCVVAADNLPPAPDAKSVAAADWFSYGSSSAMDFAFDRKSVRQSPGKVELDLRVVRKDNKQLNVAHVALDCVADTFALITEYVERDGRFLPLSPTAGKPQVTGTGFMRPLQNQLCVTWAEPEGIRWHQIGQTDNPRLYVDQAMVRALPAGGESGVFKTHVKVINSGAELVFQSRIDCRNATQENLGGLERQFYVTRMAPQAAGPIRPKSVEDILKINFCRGEVAAREAEAARWQRERVEAQSYQDERCGRIAQDAANIVNKFTSMIEAMDTPPRCSDLYLDFSNLRDLGRDALQTRCTKVDGYQIHAAADKLRSWCQ